MHVVRRAKDDRGQAGIVLALALVAVLAAVAMLTRTLLLARDINTKAASIAETGRGINTSTDAIIQLDTTNAYGRSILDTAKPLQGQLDEVIALAQSIDGKARSINSTATAINGTAKTIGRSGDAIHSTAGGISNQAGGILDVARSIKAGVVTINQTVDATIGVAQQIKADLGNILLQANAARKYGACIDEGTGGPSDGHCVR